MGEYFRVKHGYAFKGEYFDSEGPYVLLTPGSFNEEGGYREQGEKTKFYTGDVPEGYVLDEGDLLVAMTEQTPGLLGSSAWIPEGERLLHNQRLGRIVDLDERHLNKRFLYYLFNTKHVRDQISATATGGKVRHTAPERIARVLFRRPPLDTQNSIAAALSAYDDLIENNRRRMALLEEAARQLYREWCVRLRFPGHEHTGITNGVPEGWEKKTLGDLAEITMGQSPESQHYNEDGEGLPFHQGVTDFGERFVSHRIYSTAVNRIAEAGDILCSVRAPVGRLNVTLDKIVIGRGLAALRSRSGHQSLLFQQLCGHFFKENLIGGGAIFASVTKKEFFGQALLDPPERLKREFEEVAIPCDEQLRVLHQQNQQLRAARDLLLPRLMSGEIAV
jgi:type I restriction enzyme S subunit